MKINYNNKDYSIPKPFDQCYFGAEPTKMMTIHNRFSDESYTQSCKLPAFAVAIYDTIIGAGIGTINQILIIVIMLRQARKGI